MVSGWRGGGEFNFVVGVCGDCGSREGYSALVMGGVLIAALILHVLFDAEKGDIKARNVDNIVKSNFVA